GNYQNSNNPARAARRRAPSDSLKKRLARGCRFAVRRRKSDADCLLAERRNLPPSPFAGNGNNFRRKNSDFEVGFGRYLAREFQQIRCSLV
ncbi:MAG: hypothetical protein AVDCRST_MAG74-2177, partial [uncultured Pyrinomonadaceae bacterium]